MSVDFNDYVAQITTQMALVNGSISVVGDLQDATPVVLATIYAAVLNALAPFEAAIAATDADIITTSVGGVVSGQPSPFLSATLLEQTLDVEQQARLIIAASYVTRVGANVFSSPG